MKQLNKIGGYLSYNNLRQTLGLAILATVSIFAMACQPADEMVDMNANKSSSANITPTPNVDISDFDQELKSMRVAGFDYIFVLKRKDGAAFESEDRAFVRENKHYAANRFTFINDEKTLFVGSNYKFPDENLEALKERFEFQDFSKSAAQIEQERLDREAENANQNSANSNSATNSTNAPEDSTN